MENNSFKLRISKIFQSSFNSCRTKTTSDDVAGGHPFFFPENRHHRQLIDLFSPKPQPILKPKTHLQNHPKPISRPKISGQETLFPAATDAGKPPPPLFYSRTSKPTKKKKPHHRKATKSQDFSSVTDNYYYDCCSSDEDDESDDETTLFSSRSLSSDSSTSFRKNKKPRGSSQKKKKTKKKAATAAGASAASGTGTGTGSSCRDRKATDVVTLKGKGKFVKDSVAVVKRSSDPHEDFRVSMLEMIVERQIFGSQDLENLLECFLSLNSEEHHMVIFEVFSEIWETLFSEWF